MGHVSTFSVRITTTAGAVLFDCDRCGSTELLLLTQQEIERYAPVFLDGHPDRCLPPMATCS